MKGQRPCRAVPAHRAIARKANQGEMVSGGRPLSIGARRSRGAERAIPHIRNVDTEIRADRGVTKWNTDGAPDRRASQIP
jgi:hypothetical protein